MADGGLLKPIELKFRGLDADEGRIDGVQFGQSIQGTAKLYNSVLRFWFDDQIMKRPVATNIRIQVGPPIHGTLTYAIYCLMTHGKLAMYPELLWELADLAIPSIIKAIFARKAGRADLVATETGLIADLTKQHDQFATAQLEVISDGQKALASALEESGQREEKLIDYIGQLTTANHLSLKEMAQPIGRSAKSLTHFSGENEKEIVVDEPLAEAFRSPEEVTVADSTNYSATFLGVDIKTGSCRIEVEGLSGDIRCKITDPALSVPGNVYTQALNSGKSVQITAKPLIRQGSITSLYISDARALP